MLPFVNTKLLMEINQYFLIKVSVASNIILCVIGTTHTHIYNALENILVSKNNLLRINANKTIKNTNSTTADTDRSGKGMIKILTSSLAHFAKDNLW